MKTISIAAETIISGFSHFLWITVFSLLCAKVDILTVVNWLSQISVGATILLAPVVFGASHFIGTLANRIGSDLSSLVSEKIDQIVLDRARQNNTEAALAFDTSWRAKSFFLSMAVAMTMIVTTSIWADCRITSGKTFCIILLIGIPIIAITIVAFFTQRKDFLRKRDFLLSLSK